ncbi:MAG TPA: plastocyanin/azurin family copper-binding protein [Vicinamibacterales bacterium]|nr:plastocyanin/azurin family copper-binding protein [Vicinamibacterales bacterium]
MTVAMGLSLTGCSSQPGATAGAETAVVADTGSQTVTGTAPASRNSFPSIVVLEPIGEAMLSSQATTPAMDQEQQTFVPSILLVRTGQPVNFLNHDDVLHNVRVRDDETKESAFNVAIPTGETYTHTFTRNGFYDVGCDIHPGMSAQIISTSSPYTVLADAGGAFSIPDVPNGPYKAIAYSGADTITREINVAAGAAAVDLSRP